MERGYSHAKFPKIIASAYLKATSFFQLSWIILIIFELFSYVQKQPPELFFYKKIAVLKHFAQFSRKKPVLEPL